MVNENLKDAIQEAGLSLEAFAEVIQVDPKTVQRWVAGTTTPYRRHRVAISSALDLTEQDLWPEESSAGVHSTPGAGPVHGCDVIGTWAHSDKNAPDALGFIHRTAGPIDVLDSCCAIPITNEITDALLARADAGRHVRILTDGQAPRWEPLLEHPQAQIFVADIPGQYWLIKTSDRMLLMINLEHQPQHEPSPPVLELADVTGDGLFARLEELWMLTSQPEPIVATDAESQPVPDDQQPVREPGPTTRRWPGRPEE